MSTAPKGTDPFSLLVGKALVDEEFRKKVLDPGQRTAALQEVGVAHPTAEQLQALGNAVSALENLSGEFKGDVGTA